MHAIVVAFFFFFATDSVAPYQNVSENKKELIWSVLQVKLHETKLLIGAVEAEAHKACGAQSESKRPQCTGDFVVFKSHLRDTKIMLSEALGLLKVGYVKEVWSILGKFDVRIHRERIAAYFLTQIYPLTSQKIEI